LIESNNATAETGGISGELKAKRDYDI